MGDRTAAAPISSPNFKLFSLTGVRAPFNIHSILSHARSSLSTLAGDPEMTRPGIFWALLCGVALCGCGSDEPRGIALSGTVTFKGQPLSDGMIKFIPMDGNGPTAGATIENGAYSVPAAGGPRPGKHRVEVSAFKATAKTTSQGAQMFGRPVDSFPGGAEGQRVVKENVIPKKYNDNSGLTYTVPDSNLTGVDFSLD